MHNNRFLCEGVICNLAIREYLVNLKMIFAEIRVFTNQKGQHKETAQIQKLALMPLS